jgi:ATPase family associated with various cellular activities (AAA)
MRQESNQSRVCRELDRVYGALVRFSGGAAEESACEVDGASALDRVSSVFALSPFERDVLVLCAGVELESRFVHACAAAQNDPRLISPTFSLALAALPDAHWSAVNRDGPLRYWRLIEVGPGSLVRSPLKIDERILHYIAGVECGDERIEAFVRSVAPGCESIPAAHCESAEKAVAYWTSSTKPILLTARRSSDRRGVAQEICRLLDRPCFAMRAADVPSNATEREQLARLWNRESLLTGAVLCIDASELDTHDLGRFTAFLDRIQVPVAIETREGSVAEQVEGFRIGVPPLAAHDRKAIWIESLGADALRVNGSLDRIAEYFDLDRPSIRLAGDILRRASGESGLEQEAWQACRAVSRRTLDGLAHRIETRASWHDLILPDLQTETLRQIAAHVRQRAMVHGQWGFADRYARGLGVTALFAGASGTGKTMAAEVIAAELDLDLFQIDLAGVVSKYIGETEKNLRRIFDAAEDSGAVLLFDEADALFGKRSEVRDSHDRYANLEVSYLLQRMESYRGLAILTTNMKQSLDTAFLRRIRFIVQFPFPGAVERKRIWEHVFPKAAPLGPLDYTLAAKLNVPGGVIRNIATHAAFLAADQGTEIGMGHIMSAARVEYAKLERPLTPAETGGWG